MLAPQPLFSVHIAGELLAAWAAGRPAVRDRTDHTYKRSEL